MCLLSFLFGYFVRTLLQWQHFRFVSARPTKRLKNWPDHFLCATYNTWTDFLDYHVRAIFICVCFQRCWISMHIAESTLEVDFFVVIVHVYRGLVLVPPKTTRIIYFFISLFSTTNPWSIKRSSAGTILEEKSAEEVRLHIPLGSAALKAFTWFHWSKGHGQQFNSVLIYKSKERSENGIQTDLSHVGSFLQLLYVSLKTICGCSHSEYNQLKQVLRPEPFYHSKKVKKKTQQIQ